MTWSSHQIQILIMRWHLNATTGMSNPIHTIPSAQNADHLMPPGKVLSQHEDESCELTDHSPTFRSSID